VNDDDREKRPIACAFLTALQMTALALCTIISANMFLEYKLHTPVPQCPLKTEAAE